MSGALFGRLIEHASQGGDPVVPDGSRYIKRLNDPDAELMAEGVAAPVIVTRQIRLVRIEHGGELYFCTFGLSEPEEALPGLEIIDPTPGIFTLAVLEANLRPPKSVSSAAIKQVLDDRFIGNLKGYEGHDLEEIMPLFPSILVYRRSELAEYLNITDRVLGAILARTYLDGPIMLEPATVAVLVRVFENDSALIPFRNLIQGLLSISWENLYVEVCRCIEQLYALPRAGKLKLASGYAASARDLAKLLEEHLSWRPREEEAFRTLVQMCDETAVSAICAGLQHGAGETHDKRCENAVKELYGLRNQIVHYRPADERIEKSDADWNVVVRGMLDFVSHLYNSVGASFFGSGAEVVI